MSSTIMLIESSNTVSKMVEIALQGLPFVIAQAEEGEELPTALARVQPDLVLLGAVDELVMSGLAAYRESRADGLEIVLLGEPRSDQEEMPVSKHRVSLPFETRTLVATVCEALGQTPPDEPFLEPTKVDLPLANVTSDGVEPAVELDEVPAAIETSESGEFAKGTISLPVDDLDILEESIIDEVEEVVDSSLVDVIQEEVQQQVETVATPIQSSSMTAEVEE